MTAFISDTDYIYRYNYRNASGFMQVNFAKEYDGISNSPSAEVLNRQTYYVKGKIKVKEYIHYDLFQSVGKGSPYVGNEDKFTLNTQLNNPWREMPPGILSKRKRPDVIILSHNGVILDQRDNDALIDYVKNKGGTVIIMADRGRDLARLGGSLHRVSSSLPFIRSIFGSGVDDASINIGLDYLDPTYVQDNITSYDRRIRSFKLNSTLINDPVINGFYGYVGDNYWASVGDLAYVTGLNDADIINYSDNKPDGKDVLPADARVMFKHKLYNVYWIGDSKFISETDGHLEGAPYHNNTSSAYKVGLSAENNYATWRRPMTVELGGGKLKTLKYLVILLLML